MALHLFAQFVNTTVWCSPLKLPLDRYDQWKTITIRFDPKHVLQEIDWHHLKSISDLINLILRKSLDTLKQESSIQQKGQYTMFKKILTQSISSAVLLLGVPAFSGSCFGKNSTANPKSPSASEILSPADFGVLHNQLISCWTIPPGAVEAEKLDIEIEVEMNPDTTVKSAVVKSVSRKEDPFVHAFIGSALQAFKDPKCKFLALPVDRYDHWKTMSLHFDLKDIL